MRLRYLGTAAAEGWPGLFCRCAFCGRARELGGKNIRTRSQAILDDTLLIDFPPDTYLHMLRDGLDLPSIRDLLITHTHDDHLLLSDLAYRGTWFASGVDDVMTIYGNDALREKFQAFLVGEEQLAGRIVCREIEPFVAAQIAGYAVTPLLARHNPRERCYIYRIEREGRALLYGNDTGYFPEETWQALAGRRLDLVSLDCTMLAHKEGANHMGIDDVLEVRERLLKIDAADGDTQFVITHFSHNGQLLHEEAEARVAPYNILVAYDGMAVDI